MDIQYVYTRKRNQFGRPTNFSDRPAEILADIVPDLTLLQEFIYRNPVEIGVQHSIQLSEHEVKAGELNKRPHASAACARRRTPFVIRANPRGSIIRRADGRKM